MKKLFYLLLLLPLLVIAQTNESLIIENVMFSVHPEKVAEFEAGIAAHNKKFHADGPYGVRIYNVLNGTNAGKYMNIMGPFPWSAIEGRPHSKEHNEDMNKNVNPYLLADVDVNYMKMHPDLSNFSKDFEINKVSVFMVDIKRFKYTDFMANVVNKVVKVYKEKMPEQIYGIYTNEINTKKGMDFGFVSFFDSMSWMDKEDKFAQYFEEIHGANSFSKFLEDVEKTSNEGNTEIWSLRNDLSGPNAKILATTRE